MSTRKCQQRISKFASAPFIPHGNMQHAIVLKVNSAPTLLAFCTGLKISFDVVELTPYKDYNLGCTTKKGRLAAPFANDWFYQDRRSRCLTNTTLLRHPTKACSLSLCIQPNLPGPLFLSNQLVFDGIDLSFVLPCEVEAGCKFTSKCFDLVL